MINSEKDLEDYICNNQEKFINKLKEIYNAENIEFIGRQVKLGRENIADLVYIMQTSMEYPIQEIIIVELKYRELQCKDLSQINRYISTLKEKDEYSNFENINGCFVSFGCSSEMMDVSKNEEHIKFISIECELNFVEENYHYTEDYLKNIELDDRLKIYMTEGEDNE